MSSSAERSTGNHELGFAAAISVMGASSSPSCAPVVVGRDRRDRPAGRRRATRRSATPGTPRGRPRPDGTAPRTGTAASRSAVKPVRRSPAFLNRRCVSSASAPVMTAHVGARRARIRSAAVLHQHLRHRAADARVVLPGAARSRPLAPTAPDGSSYGHVWQYTTSRLSTAPRTSPVAPASAAAARATSAHIASGSGAPRRRRRQDATSAGPRR